MSIYTKLKAAMVDAGHVLSEGDGFLIHEYDKVRDFLHSTGMTHIGDNFELWESEMEARLKSWGHKVEDTTVADAEKAKATAEAEAVVIALKAKEETAAVELAAKQAADELNAKIKAEAAVAEQVAKDAAVELESKAQAEAAKIAQDAADTLKAAPKTDTKE